VRVELLGLEADAAGKLCGPKHQQEIAKDRARDRRLDQVNETRTQRQGGDDQLGKVAEGRVEQPADCGTGVSRELLRRVTENAREWNDRESAQREDEQRRAVHQLGDDGDRREQKEPVQVLHG
jgi:hypothetical protein